jgi:hypothetical protein
VYATVRIEKNKLLIIKQVNKMENTKELNKEKQCDIHVVVDSVLRPKNGYELLAFLKENKKCEIVDTHAFLAAKALEDNNCGFSFSFKKSKWTSGWAGFERSL